MYLTKLDLSSCKVRLKAHIKGVDEFKILNDIDSITLILFQLSRVVDSYTLPAPLPHTLLNYAKPSSFNRVDVCLLK